VVGRGEGGGGLTDADVEASRFQAGACGIAGVGVVAVGAVRGDQGGGVAEPEGAEGGEDDEGECVAEDPLSRRQYPGGECVGRSRTSPIPPRTINSPPAKKYHPMLAEPLPPAPRHPISVQLRGVRDSKKPQSALVMVSEGEREDVAVRPSHRSWAKDRASRTAQGKWKCSRPSGFASGPGLRPCCCSGALHRHIHNLQSVKKKLEMPRCSHLPLGPSRAEKSFSRSPLVLLIL
jgi:hypothetical protein